jgi:hypothetical protein
MFYSANIRKLLLRNMINVQTLEIENSSIQKKSGSLHGVSNKLPLVKNMS